MNKFLLAALAAGFLSAGLNAQGQKPCGTDEVMHEYYKQNPEAQKAREAREALLEKQDAVDHKNGYKKESEQNKTGPNQTNMPPVYIIPVVFHVLHQGGSENITDAQVKDAVNILTRDYRKLNPDTTVTISIFKALAGDAEIEFRLATIDPNGQCTNGIIRHNTANTNWTSGSGGAYTGTTAGLWNPTKYLNVYTVKSISSGAAGYTYLPGTWGTGNNHDMIVILHDYVGSIGTGSVGRSRALTHEVGHWFNLAHTWGSTNQPGVSCTGSDGVADTPQTDGSTTCNLSKSTCNSPVIENVQNYMDYSYCSTMFTDGQVTRMRNAATSSTGGRNNLWSSTNLLNTGVTNPQVCAPIADFHATNRTVCPNYVITFSDSSANATPTQWNWSFPGGTFQNGTTATDSMPKVSYATPGTYAVSYTATTTGGSDAITKTSYITVQSNVASYNTPWTESFETATLPGADWSLLNITGTNWAISSAAAATGTKSVKMDNMVNSAGNTSVLESTSFDISSFITPKFSFKYAYKQKTTANNDKLQVFSSTDCGNTWVSRWSRNGSTLANVTPAATSAFTPTTAQFLTYTVNINGVAGQSNVRFRFVFFADFGGTGSVGNNLFMDDINIWDGSLTVALPGEEIDMAIFPNPSSGQVTINLNLPEKHVLGLTVTDVLGRQMESITAHEFAAGESSITIADKIPYPPGMYLLNFEIDGKQFTRKVMMH